MIPGEYILGDGDIEANAGRRTVELTVANTADRPIQVGSHFHFFEANRALRFDRGEGLRACGSTSRPGTAVRFEPGDEKVVTLVELAGAREVYGLNALTDGVDAARRDAAVQKRARRAGFLGARGREPPAAAAAVRRSLRPDRRATGCGSPTRTSSSRSSATSRSTATR